MPHYNTLQSWHSTQSNYNMQMMLDCLKGAADRPTFIVRHTHTKTASQNTHTHILLHSLFLSVFHSTHTHALSPLPLLTHSHGLGCVSQVVRTGVEWVLPFERHCALGSPPVSWNGKAVLPVFTSLRLIGWLRGRTFGAVFVSSATATPPQPPMRYFCFV